VDQILSALPPEERWPARIYVPVRREWSPVLKAIEIIEDDAADSQWWEQLSLPRLAADGVLINLCNLAPLLHRRKLLMIHDAQFLFSDNSLPLQRRLGYKYLIPLMAKRSQKIVTVSEFSKRTLDITKIAKSESISVIHNAADHMLSVKGCPDLLESLHLEPNRFVLVFGSTKTYKNVQVVFDALTDPRLADFKLIVVADEEAEIREAGLRPSPNAIFVGHIGDDRLKSLYENATCIAFPSKTEGFGLPPLEAMLLGCPAIVAPAGAIPEVCHDAVLYASVNDPEEWASAIIGIAKNSELRARKIAAGIARSKHFTWVCAAQQLLALAKELAIAA